jgi:putative component of membrane protein insertase Oxa1/YidC/SpoIIIJ protein YidD
LSQRPDLGARAAVAAIGAYRRFVSPYKGFCCAWRAHTGGASCSTLGLRAIRRYGCRRGLGVLRRRLDRCGIAHRRCSKPRAAARREAGFCDLACVPCDIDCGSAACGAIECGACDLPWDACGRGRSKRGQDDENVVYIPRARGAREP